MPFFERIREDIRSVMERDPAARSKLEILTCYPGLWAVWIHRISHALWRARLYLPARFGVQTVYDALKRDILEMTLPPGEALDETRLSRRFSMSRTPVREALVRLAAEGLVTTLPLGLRRNAGLYRRLHDRFLRFGTFGPCPR